MRHLLAVLLLASVLAAGEVPLLGGQAPAPAWCGGFLSWQELAGFRDGRLWAKGKDGRGGLTATVDLDPAALAELTPRLRLRVLPGNQARALKLRLVDGDGTSRDFTFALPEAPGEAVDLLPADADAIGNPVEAGEAGKQAGMGRIVTVALVGPWNDAPCVFEVEALTAVPADAAMLAKRTAAAARLAEQSRQREREAAQAAQAARDLLEKGSPHPADGPAVTWIGAVAPDVLAFSLQACTAKGGQLLPYAAQPGDEVKDEKEVFHEVFDDGVKERHLRSVWRKGAKLGLLTPDGKQLAVGGDSTGQVLDERVVDQPTAYAITADGDPAYAKPVAPTAVFRKGKPNGRSRPLPFAYTISLRLPTPLKEGATYHVALNGLNTSKASVDYVHQPRQARSLAIHTLQTGHRPDDPCKRAYCSFWMGVDKDGKQGSCTPAVTAFELLDAKNGKTVFTGTAEQSKRDGVPERYNVHEELDHTRSAVYRLDYSAFTTPGEYLVHVPSVGVSYPVRIAADVWEAPFKAAMQGILAQRQGIDLGPPALAFIRKRAFHPDDGVRFYQMTITCHEGQEAGEGGHAGRGGNLLELAKAGKLARTTIVPGAYQDAGDWDTLGHHLSATYDLLGCYLLNPAAVKRTRLSLPAAEMANNLPDLLDEAMWQMPTWKSLQQPDGGVRGGYGYGWGCVPGQTSAMMTSAGVYAVDLSTTLHYAAAAARAARILADFDKAKSAEWLASARKAWDWAEANTKGKGDANARAEAAVELLAATREPAFDAAFKQSTELTGTGLYLGQPGADFAYARLPEGLGDPALKQAAVTRIAAYADHAIEFSSKSGFNIVAGRRTDLPMIGPCTWFSVPAQGGMLPIYAYELTRKPQYLALAVQGAHFSLGANPDNLSYCTGVGQNWQRHPFMVDGHVTGQDTDVPVGHIPYGQGNEGGPMSRGANAWVQTWFLNFGPTKKMTPNWYEWPIAEAYIDFSVYPMINENCFNQTEVPAACYWFWLANRQ